MGGFGVKFNFINFIIFLIWFGFGVDVVFYMFVCFDEVLYDVGGFWYIVGVVFVVFGMIMIGFGGLMVLSYCGLNLFG